LPPKIRNHLPPPLQLRSLLRRCRAKCRARIAQSVCVTSQALSQGVGESLDIVEPVPDHVN
jgi:hypothetical protein